MTDAKTTSPTTFASAEAQVPAATLPGGGLSIRAHPPTIARSSLPWINITTNRSVTANN